MASSLNKVGQVLVYSRNADTAIAIAAVGVPAAARTVQRYNMRQRERGGEEHPV